MVEHQLKTLACYWDAIKRGEKTFEVRRDDRGFQKGDELILCRTPRHDGRVKMLTLEGEPEWFAEEDKIIKTITYILTGEQFGIEPGYVVLGLGEPS